MSQNVGETKAQQQKHAQFKVAHQLIIALFRDARENIQPYLVSEDGELGTELEKMKGRMAKLREKWKAR